MGKTEKIVVLSFLFVIAVLFVWSLDQGDGIEAAGDDSRSDARSNTAANAAANDEGSSSGDAERGGQASPGAQSRGATALGGDGLQRRGQLPGGSELEGPQGSRSSQGPAIGGSDSGPILVAEVGQRAGQAPAAPIDLRPEWDLRIVRGLERTLDPEVFVGVAGPDDTWATLAELYYGDGGKERLLRRSNEGTALKGGVKVLVPAIDRLPVRPEVREVEVLDGEGLWHVAERVYGSGAKWMKIYEANQDRLPNKDVVRPGTLLRIPDLGGSAD